MSKIVDCLRKLGYHRLTELQKKVFNIVTSTGQSVIIVAPTGSGKTEAALFPIMYLIRRNRLKPISAIYITPLRALNRDIEDRIKRIAECFELSVALRHGDTPYSLRKHVEKNPPHILVTTPETLNYLLVNDRLRKYLSNLEFIVIDEYRELVESKRGHLLFTVLYLFEKYVIGRNIRKIVLTATLENEDLARRLVASGGIHDAIVVGERSARRAEIEIIVPNQTYASKYGIDKLIHDRELASRLGFIIDLLEKYRGVLIFTNTRSIAEKLGFLLSTVIEELELNNLSVATHHGSLSRLHRISVEQGFKQGLIKGLIATSSMELGIDIGRIDYVVQYMSPRQATRLLQRIGRSRHVLGGVSKGAVLVAKNLFQILESTVLARRALKYELERETRYSSPLDVLAYAIAVLTLIFPNGLNIYELYNTLIKHPLYEDLDLSSYTRLLEYLEYARIIRIEHDMVKPTRRTRVYVYRVTMIPDTRDISVIEVSSGKKIGVLNEEYVVLNIERGDTIVLGGIAWRVIDYNAGESRLYVEKIVGGQEIIIPHWEGESIPVEYRVAREVGSIVRRIKHGIQLGEYHRLSSIFKDMVNSLGRAIEEFGDDREVVIDYCGEHGLITINVYGGTRVNRFLRDLFKTIITSRYPFLNISVYSTPYAVFIKINKKVYSDIALSIVDLIENTLHNITSYLNEESIKTIAMKQGTLHWRIYQVAQRFGAIDPEKGPIPKSILEGFIDTIVGYEAFKEVLYRDYDIDSIHRIAEQINRGVLKIVKRFSDRLSTYHYELLGYVEVPVASEVKPFDRELYRERVLNRMITLICIHCGFIEHGRIREYISRSNYKCPRCGYRTLAVIKSNGLREREVIEKNSRGEKLSREEKRVLEDLRKRAILLVEYGSLALHILGARGVGVNDVARIIDRVKRGEDLYQVLYEYEKRAIYARKYSEKKGYVGRAS